MSYLTELVTGSWRWQTVKVPALATLAFLILGATATQTSRARQPQAESTVGSQAEQSRAEEWMQEGRYEEAKDVWTRLAKEHPEDATVHIQPSEARP